MMQPVVRGAHTRPLPMGFPGRVPRLAPQGQRLSLSLPAVPPAVAPACMPSLAPAFPGHSRPRRDAHRGDRRRNRHPLDFGSRQNHGTARRGDRRGPRQRCPAHGRDSLKADFARYFRSTRWIFLKGSVKALWQEDQLEAEEAEFDIVNQEGWLKKGRLFVSGPHLYFSGDVIRKLRGDEYTFKNAKITACDGDEPAWSLSAESGEITIDGYARLRKADFRVGGRTAMYTPHLILPVKTRRQSGLLVPDTGYSSRREYTSTSPSTGPWTKPATSRFTKTS